MDESVNLMDEIDFERIQGNAQEINRLCNARDI